MTCVGLCVGLGFAPMGVSGSACVTEVGMWRRLRAGRGTRVRGIRYHAPLALKLSWDEERRGPAADGSRFGIEAPVRGGVRQGRNEDPSRFICDPLPGSSDPICTAPAQTPEVWVPSAVASANRLGSEIRVGYVPSSWEQV